MADEMQCTRCGAPLALPSDFGVWLVHCQYCGFEHELPDRAGRQAYAEQQRELGMKEADAQAARLARQAWDEKYARSKRNQTLLVITIPVVLVLGAVGGLSYLISTVGGDPTPTRSQTALTPPPALSALAAKAQAEGCSVAVNEPTRANGEYSSKYQMVKHECVRFVAVATPATALSLTIVDPNGGVTTRPAPTGTLDTTYCPKADDEHQVKVRGGGEFWVQAFGCPRKFGSDSATTGKDKVGARLKQLMTHGCYDVALANTVYLDERKFTTDLTVGTCFDVIASSGVPDNELKLTLSTPFGESVTPMPAPATDLEVAYCAANAGPHVVETTAAVNAPYSVAIAICNRNVLPKVLPKAGE
jgi:hypothetical protein